MLTSLTIENFRNLESVTLERLGRVTLIAGKKSGGKTALIEALWLLSGPNLPELSERVNAFRGLPPLGRDHIFRSIFGGFDAQRRIKVVTRGDWGNRPRKLEIFLLERQGVGAVRSVLKERAFIGRSTLPQIEGEFEVVFSYQHHNGEKHESRA